MEDFKDLLEKRKREINAHRESALIELGPKAKLTATQTCSVCGSYAQKPAIYLSEKYSFEDVYCIYCLSHALGRNVKDLEEEYKSDQ